ncbi:uncharacterized [Tachysurus ichikawai]
MDSLSPKYKARRYRKDGDGAKNKQSNIHTCSEGKRYDENKLVCKNKNTYTFKNRVAHERSQTEEDKMAHQFVYRNNS